jgi:hypothetical protein
MQRNLPLTITRAETVERNTGAFQEFGRAVQEAPSLTIADLGTSCSERRQPPISTPDSTAQAHPSTTKSPMLLRQQK